MKIITLLLSLLFTVTLTAQGTCDLKTSLTKEIKAVDVKDMKCMAQNASQKNTLFFTFGIWCEPCRLHLPNAIKFAADNNLNFYVLLVEPEADAKTKEAIDYLKKIKADIQIVVLKDEVYGTKRSKKNKKFVAEITPDYLEAIDDYSKYILFNKEGKVQMVTNWKDNKGNDWKDDTQILKTKLLPFLE